jgi:hypothetical protein
VEETAARRLARRLARRDAEALSATCCAAAGENGLALAWAVVDMIKDDDVHLAALPLAEVADLLEKAATGDGARLRAQWAALMEAVEAEADEIGAAGDDDRDGVWEVAA